VFFLGFVFMNDEFKAKQNFTVRFWFAIFAALA
jgi:hypothetical protein